MDRRTFLATAAALAATPALAQQRVTLNVLTAGDQNMVDYITDYLGPMFQRQNPGVTVRALGTGPGDAGSQRIWERLEAQRRANTNSVDVDVAVVHQTMAGRMVAEGLLSRFRDQASTGQLATSDVTRNALGQNVDGFVLPMFNSQIALAYNPARVATPPRTFAELENWVRQNPRRFGYNGIRGGMSGVGFVFGWAYAFGPDQKRLIEGPFDAEAVSALTPAFQRLREFNRNVVITPGNAGTLDAMNRGEIDIGPVWMDMFYSWQAEGRLNPAYRLVLPETGLPGQPMYYVIPARAANNDVARRFIELATSPSVQAEGIVRRFNWLPGIDAQHVRQHLDQQTWDRLFRDVGPDQLARGARPMPQADFMRALQEAYERVVLN
ncbi:extracellular solute-binding protein [Falsiroseomonas stagni]|uniref:Extracellular solute-binding protein n=1 Tax=Falsiroseomonas stagni DSM 19981 TaxID=1123062 RepID=A0A1I3ZQR5_9PROT|nr:extracellular solute-binding protein [Falsiroseomonas stagni]SFK46317.1 extracellular solute-binding protein [Falsiroseomonas stagni DSM 19981]